MQTDPTAVNGRYYTPDADAVRAHLAAAIGTKAVS